jgi:hypothetical protein
MLIIALKNPARYRKLLGVPLLNKFFRLRADRMNQLQDRIAVEAAYKAFYTAAGSSKETSWNRLAEVDPLTLNLLNPLGPNVIHDMGVSSGVTSVDLHRQLVKRGIPFELIISDKFARYYCTGELLRRVYDEEGTLAQAYVFGLLCDRQAHWKYFVSKYGYHLVRLLPKGKRIEGELCLYDPELLALLEQGAIREIKYDVFTSRLEEKFDLIRCMNVLNLSYFGPSKIAAAIMNFHSSLKDKGVLQIGRTALRGQNEVSFFRKEQGQLRLLADVNGGSEIRHLVKTAI